MSFIIASSFSTCVCPSADNTQSTPSRYLNTTQKVALYIDTVLMPLLMTAGVLGLLAFLGVPMGPINTISHLGQYGLVGSGVLVGVGGAVLLANTLLFLFLANGLAKSYSTLLATKQPSDVKEEEIERLQQALGEADANLNMTKEALRKAENELLQLDGAKGSLAKKEEEVEALREEIDELQETVKNLIESKAAAESACFDQDEEIKDLKGKLEEAREKLTEKIAQFEELQKGAVAGTETHGHEAAFAQLREKLQEVQQQLSEKVEALNRLQNLEEELRGVKADLEAKNKEAKALGADKIELEAALKDSGPALEDLRKKLEELQKLIPQLTDERDGLVRDLRSFREMEASLGETSARFGKVITLTELIEAFGEHQPEQPEELKDSETYGLTDEGKEKEVETDPPAAPPAPPSPPPAPASAGGSTSVRVNEKERKEEARKVVREYLDKKGPLPTEEDLEYYKLIIDEQAASASFPLSSLLGKAFIDPKTRSHCIKEIQATLDYLADKRKEIGAPQVMGASLAYQEETEHLPGDYSGQVRKLIAEERVDPKGLIARYSCFLENEVLPILSCCREVYLANVQKRREDAVQARNPEEEKARAKEVLEKQFQPLLQAGINKADTEYLLTALNLDKLDFIIAKGEAKAEEAMREGIFQGKYISISFNRPLEKNDVKKEHIPEARAKVAKDLSLLQEIQAQLEDFKIEDAQEISIKIGQAEFASERLQYFVSGIRKHAPIGAKAFGEALYRDLFTA